MGRLKEGLKRAFWVEPPGPAQPDQEHRVIVDKIAAEIVRRGLVTPALMFLEMSRPLNNITAQGMHFFTPIISAVIDSRGYEHLAEFLERRGSIEYICLRIEALEHASRRRPESSDCSDPGPRS